MPDFSNIANFFISLGAKNPLEIAWIFFIRGGWLLFLIFTLKLLWDLRMLRLWDKFSKRIEHVILAIDIPKDSEQTPKAMEQVFATISGAHTPLSRREKYLEGILQLSFSFEVISIDGYVQFLIRTPKIHRDLVEASIHAHYPDAEITEVEDYTQEIPSQYPNDRYNIWGSELSLVANEAYPLRTYKFFEDPISQEIKDPLAGLVETMSRIQKNEHVWLQIVVVPTENSSWVKRALAQAYKIVGRKAPVSKHWYDWLLNFLYHLPNWIPWTQQATIEQKPLKPIELGGIFNLTPGERSSLEAIESKASKIGFICKVRLIYASTHEQYQTGRVVASVFGAIKQFGDLTLNSFKPNKRTKTKVIWFNIENRINARRRRLMRNYKARSWYAGSNFFILNTEELATLYHFPSITVKSAMLKRTEVKKSEAPSNLPSEPITETAAAVTEDLRSQLEGLRLDNDYYERKFAVRPSPKHQEPAETRQSSSAPRGKEADIPHNLPISQ